MKRKYGAALARETLAEQQMRERAAEMQDNSFNFGVYNGRAYFAADNGTNGAELWVTDGTPGGTVMLKDINPGSGASAPGGWAVLNGVLYFSATDAQGTELWRTDGTAGGTSRVKDIYAGATGSGPAALTVYKNALYFAETDAAAGTSMSTGLPSMKT